MNDTARWVSIIDVSDRRVVLTLTRDSATGSQLVMHVGRLSVAKDSKPIGQMQSLNWTSRYRVESVELLQGPSAKRFIVSELCGENTLNVTLLQLFPTVSLFLH